MHKGVWIGQKGEAHTADVLGLLLELYMCVDVELELLSLFALRLLFPRTQYVLHQLQASVGT